MDPEAQIEYVGADTVDGMETEVVKVSYEQGPTSRYWQSETGGDQPDAASQGGTAHQEEANHDDGHGPSGHHSGRETYYYHFDTTNHEIKKIYFSHHGDESFETLYLRDYAKINGINREHSRELIGPDGEKLYDSRFTKIEFRKGLKDQFYRVP